MQIMLSILLLLVGFVFLVKGADWFVDGATGIAAYFKIPELIVGLTIVAMGTSMPEAAVSVTAALKGNNGITIGNVVGSNILNIWIILGVTALIICVPVARSTIRCEIPFMIAITVVLGVLGYTGQMVTRLEGVCLWILFLVYMGYLIRSARRDQKEIEEQPKEISIGRMLLLTAAGLAVIILGSDMAVDGATQIAKAIGISERFIGLTIVALGTSLPELFTSVVAAKKGNADLAIGNIVGSNIFNILFIVGTASLIIPISFEPEFLVDTIVATLAGVVLWLSVCKEKKLTKKTGIIMLLAYGVYFIYLLQ